MQRKFALVGAAKVEKTAIFEDLKRKLSKNSDVAFVKEAARDLILTLKPKSPFTLKFQSRIQDEVLRREKEAQSYPIVICDRSVIDAVVYCQALGFKKEAKKLHLKVVNWIPSYTKLFLLDIFGIPFKKDKVRKDETEFREKVQQFFLEFLKKEKLPYKLIKGIKEERLRQIRREIEKK